MIEPFAQPAWADAHDEFSRNVSAGLGYLARWLRRRAEAERQTPTVMPHSGKRRPPQPRTPAG